MSANFQKKPNYAPLRKNGRVLRRYFWTPESTPRAESFKPPFVKFGEKKSKTPLKNFYIFNGDHFWVKWTKKTRLAKIFKSNKIARFSVTGDLNVNFDVINPLRSSGAITKRDIPDSKKKLDSRRFPESNAPLFFELRQILDLL